MALVKCSLCDKNVNTTAKNYLFANGVHQHVKCPSSNKLNDQDKAERRELTDAIQWLGVKHDKPLNWSLITKQIKSLLEKGYSYKTQLDALKWLVEKDGEFWGYGRLEKFMPHYEEHKKKLAEFEEKKRQVEKSREEQKTALNYNSKPSFFEMADEKPDFL